MKNINIDDSSLSSGKKKTTKKQLKMFKIKKDIKLPDIRFWKGINLLDGQRRGEIIFRRVFLVLVLYTIVLLLANMYGDKVKGLDAFSEAQENEVEAVEEVEIGVDGVGNVVEEGDVVNGQEVVVEDGRATYKQEYHPVDEEIEAIRTFVFDTYRGAFTVEYFDLLAENCSTEALRTVIAISVAETSMGKNTNRISNFYGWFKGGDKSYDPSYEEMAQEICRGIEENYLGIESSDKLISIYTGNSNTSSWKDNFLWAYNKMSIKE